MGIESDIDTAFAEAVRIAGGQSAFGRAVGLSQGYVHELLRDHKPLPAGCVLKAEAATGVSRHDLRPDLYPRESVADGAAR
jgi:DNA-binding transcriptional regulator YdaS (Cro superfamily)